MLHKVVFLDRDGVINRDSPDYIKRLEEFEFLPGSLEALRRLTERGFTCMVITNQSAPARGLMTPEALAAIHRRLCADVATAGGRILDIFTCPHLPADGCSCRKPQPGLLYAAQRKYGIDFSSAAMIGDSAKDIECALNAGVGVFCAGALPGLHRARPQPGGRLDHQNRFVGEGDASARSVLKNKHPDVRIRVQGAREQAV
jgi:D-glycero-D-manno-heptose 1,7-bisphosphate phosphatase